MKLLLTSGGVTNPSIHASLVELLDKPVTESKALVIPTAQWGHPSCGPASVRGLIAAEPVWEPSPVSAGRPSASSSYRAAHHRCGTLGPLGARGRRPARRRRRRDLPGPWMRESGLADLLPSLTDTVWVGVSAGSMVMTPRIGDLFVAWADAPDDRTLGVVDFSIFPHLNAFPTNTPAEAERWAADLGAPAYAIDEQTAITVVDGRAEVVSEGEWTAFGL